MPSASPIGALILTRPEAAATRFLSSLDAAALKDVEVVLAPLMRIVSKGSDRVLPLDAAAIFTARAGVEHAPHGNGRAAFCVGKGTAEHARQLGWSVKAVAETADDLVQAIQTDQITRPVVHYSGRHVRGNIVARLALAGWNATQEIIYDQVMQPLPKAAKAILLSPVPTIVPLFSPRTAAHFQLEAPKCRKTTAIALSLPVATALENSSTQQVITLARPDIDLMKAEVEKQCSRLSLS